MHANQTPADHGAVVIRQLLISTKQPVRLASPDIRVSPVSRPGSNPRTLSLAIDGPAGGFELLLSAGKAAELMFEIGYALEQAARRAAPRTSRISCG